MSEPLKIGRFTIHALPEGLLIDHHGEGIAIPWGEIERLMPWTEKDHEDALLIAAQEAGPGASWAEIERHLVRPATP